MLTVGAVQYGTATEIAARLGPDVTPAMVRAWARRHGLPAHRDGRTVWYPLDDAARIEARKRMSGRGRARRVDTKPLITA